MRKLILMTSAAVIAPLSCFAENITCTATPNCADLGYTNTTSCDNGVKCLWGEAWYCPPSPPEVCEIGSILYSDMTCYKEAQAGKTPIGVVVYVDGLGGGQAMALDSIGRYTWGGYGTDISGLPNYTSTSTASKDYASCENSKIIMAAGDKSKYPAAWAANEYSTEGTSAGDWCLPAAGIFTSYYNNQTSVNLGFERVNGTKFTTSTNAWSSSENNSGDAWLSNFVRSYGLNTYYSKGNYGEVRPVFEFVQTFEGVCKASQQYLCKGENETGGVGEACAGKYSECSCDEGFIWTGSDCKRLCEAGSELGYILYSDMTRSAELDSTKTPIGIVVCSYRDGGGQALALNSIGYYRWGGYGTDISSLPNYGSAAAAFLDLDSCGNTAKIIAAGDNADFPAAWAVNEYSTEGTSAGDWCLPAAGIINSYRFNQTAINLGFEKADGTKFTTSTYAWSSSEINSYGAWYSGFNSSNGLYSTGKDGNLEVRPVLAF